MLEFLTAALTSVLAPVGLAVALALGLAMLPRVLNAFLDSVGYPAEHRFNYPEMLSFVGNLFVMVPALVAVGLILAFVHLV